jgi:hypothetical protein
MSRSNNGQRGIVLVSCLVLLLVVTVLATAGSLQAAVSLLVTGNAQAQEAAYAAAEAGIEAALLQGAYSVDPSDTAARYDNALSLRPSARPGAGTPIPGCSVEPSAQAQPCEYFVRPDRRADPYALPGGDSLGAGLAAYHFLVESHGRGARGAVAVHEQGFFVIGPAVPECIADFSRCALTLTNPPVRTWWRRDGAGL